MAAWNIRILEEPEEMSAVEQLQREVWPGSETDIVPSHLLITAVHNGGVVLGAFDEDKLVGFVFGFPGIESTPDGPRPKHCSHMAGVLASHRDRGLGFALKRAQWQVVRHQGLDHMTWTYDMLLSRNAYLNISRLGAVCSTYRRSEYGEMRDGLNAGLPSDRFQVDWWLNTPRVERRLSKRARPPLTPAALSRMGVQPLYELQHRADGLRRPPEHMPRLEDQLLAAEIPVDFTGMKAADLGLARDWRFFAREFFETAFGAGYIVTDFVFDKGGQDPRSIYVLTDGESTLEVQAMMQPSLLQRVMRRLDKTLASAFFIDQWVILTARRADYRDLHWEDFTPLMPEKDRYWGDPFVLRRNGRHFVFVEEKTYATGRGHIACLQLDDEGALVSQEVVLQRDYHLSYPFIFEGDAELYMIPETAANRTVELYRCEQFPDRWGLVKVLLRDVYAVDATLLEADGAAWLFANVEGERRIEFECAASIPGSESVSR